MNFLHLMNQKRFQITNAQLTELEKTTCYAVGTPNVQVTQLTKVDMVNGKAIMVVGKAHYEAVRRATTGRWYLTGEYTFA